MTRATMTTSRDNSGGEVTSANNTCCGDQSVQIMSAPPVAKPSHDGQTNDGQTGEIACCGRPSYPASSPFERPGYRVSHFVSTFTDTAIGPVPVIRSRRAWQDRLGTIMARIGFRRDNYKVAPGIYAVGNPNGEAPVLVTANYKLSFDALRQSLEGMDAWLLVIDTRGINVWCAAGKGTFGTDELVSRIETTRLAALVTHRELILPQLGATGVSATKVKKAAGFKVIWGPVQARDVKKFLNNGKQAPQSMRRITFTLPERMVLIPVELYHLPKQTLWVVVAALILSGIGTTIFSLSMSWFRGWLAIGAYLVGVFAGAVASPALLPWLPGRAFAIKGAVAGVVAAVVLLIGWRGSWHGLEALSLILLTTATSSYLAMNFTGSTPYTSPTGVEKEMRKAIPLQAVAVVLAAVIWVATPFT